MLEGHVARSYTGRSAKRFRELLDLAPAMGTLQLKALDGPGRTLRAEKRTRFR
jgi:hypothetical protein